MKRLRLFAAASVAMMLMMVFAVSCTKPNVEHEYVDLGLPSGTLWATCNIGATTPEGYGDYFAWGETKAKSVYNWETYKYAKGYFDVYPLLTKYCTDDYYGNIGFVDNLTLLQPSDDAATANWGSGWRMPTNEEWQELLDNTTNTWTTQNGVNGRLFTATNGNSLFLPAAGYRDDSNLYNSGNDCFCWSSSLSTDHTNGAWSFGYYILLFLPVEDVDLYYRYPGHSVRAVRSPR